MGYENLKEHVIRIWRKKVFYFDTEGIYTGIPIETARRMKDLKGLKSDYYKLGEFCSEMDFSGATARAILGLAVGDSIEKLEKETKRFENIEKRAENSQDYRNKILRKSSHKVYFFNESREWMCLSENEAFVADISMPYIWLRQGKDISYEVNIRNEQLLLQELGTENIALVCKAIAKLEKGDSIERLKEFCNGGVKLKEKSKMQNEGIIAKINDPEFRCKPENPDKKSTFDYIIVDIALLTTWEGDKKAYIEENKKKLTQKVLEKIKENKKFLKYNVPINYLKVAKITLYNNRNNIQYILELKTL